MNFYYSANVPDFVILSVPSQHTQTEHLRGIHVQAKGDQINPDNHDQLIALVEEAIEIESLQYVTYFY